MIAAASSPPRPSRAAPQPRPSPSSSGTVSQHHASFPVAATSAAQLVLVSGAREAAASDHASNSATSTSSSTRSSINTSILKPSSPVMSSPASTLSYLSVAPSLEPEAVSLAPLATACELGTQTAAAATSQLLFNDPERVETSREYSASAPVLVPQIGNDARTLSSPTAEPPSSQPIQVGNTVVRAPSEFSPFELGMRDIIRNAIDTVIQLHDQEHCLIKPAAIEAIPTGHRERRTSADGSGGTSIEDDEQASRDFAHSFLSSSSSPSQTRDLAEGGSETRRPSTRSTSTSAFARSSFRATGLLMWRLEHYLGKEVAAQREVDRTELARMSAKIELLEHELAEARNNGRDEQLSDLNSRIDMIALQTSNQRLQLQIDEMTDSHARDLEGAVRVASDLGERIDVLQMALNDTTAHATRQRTTEEDAQQVWATIIEDQTRALVKKVDAMRALTGPLTCSTCQEIMNRPTTLSCGHSGCSRCLRRWFERSGVARSCPTCRASVLFSESTSLKLNVVLEDVVRELKKIGLEDT